MRLFTLVILIQQNRSVAKITEYKQKHKSYGGVACDTREYNLAAARVSLSLSLCHMCTFVWVLFIVLISPERRGQAYTAKHRAHSIIILFMALYHHMVDKHVSM